MKTNYKYSNDTNLAVSIAVGHHFVSVLLFMDIISCTYTTEFGIITMLEETLKSQ